MFNSDGGRLPPKTLQQKTLKAASYAAFAENHPIYRLKAQGTQISAYSLALLDSLGKPQLLGIDIQHWTGRIGQNIHIQVTDNIHVLQVRVMIREDRMSDWVLESGHAYPSRLDPLIWTYVTKTEIQQFPGFCIDVIATDLAGNVGVDTMEFT